MALILSRLSRRPARLARRGRSAINELPSRVDLRRSFTRGFSSLVHNNRLPLGNRFGLLIGDPVRIWRVPRRRCHLTYRYHLGPTVLGHLETENQNKLYTTKAPHLKCLLWSHRSATFKMSIVVTSYRLHIELAIPVILFCVVYTAIENKRLILFHNKHDGCLFTCVYEIMIWHVLQFYEFVSSEGLDSIHVPLTSAVLKTGGTWKQSKTVSDRTRKKYVN